MTTGFYSLPSDISGMIESYRNTLRAYLNAEMTPEEFRPVRVLMGVYEERTPESFLVRVRLAGGIVSSAQLRGIADIVEEFAKGVPHLTTRQNLQLHGIPLGDTPRVFERLLALGLVTRGGGGDSVRNVTSADACDACRGESFDVRPHALAVTSYLLGLADSWTLPRKFKIAFSGCRHDRALATVADVGFVAARNGGGARGFAVYGGGGLGARSRVGLLLEPWTAEDEVGVASEALRRIFHRLGDRGNRSRARLRFVVEKMGEAAFRALYLEEKLGLVRSGDPSTRIDLEAFRRTAPSQAVGSGAASLPLPDGLAESEWARRSVRREAEGSAWSVELWPTEGDVKPDVLRRIAALAEKFGSGVLQTTQLQSIRVLGVSVENVTLLREALEREPWNLAGSEAMPRVVSCTGARICRPGLRDSREAREAVIRRIDEARLAPLMPPDLTIHLSGCANNCGQHSVAALGFSGASIRRDDGALPAFQVHVGGLVEAGRTRLGRVAGKIPAAAVADFCEAVIRDCAESGLSTFQEYLEARPDAVLPILQRHGAEIVPSAA